MIDPERVKELEAIKQKKSKMPKHKIKLVRVNSYTLIGVREGKDLQKAVEDFNLKTSDEYRNNALYRPKI